MLTNDINAALFANLPDPQFVQDAGGWGGSFYYWNEAINYGAAGPRLTVGDAILNGLPATATPTGTGQAASLNEFIVANSRASADAIVNSFKTSATGYRAYSQFEIGSALSYGMKQLNDLLVSGSAAVSASTPADIKQKLIEATSLDIFKRVVSGNFDTGPHGPSFPASSQSTSTYTGDQIQTTYADGDTVQSDLGLDGDQAHSHWSSADGTTGDIVITPNTAGALTATVAWKDGLGPGSTGNVSYNADRSSLGKATYASGQYAIARDDGQGNLLINYYAKNGNRIADSWIYADGSSGSEFVFNDGLTHTGPGTANSSAFGTFVHADGSYELASHDPNDIKTTQAVDARGDAAAPTHSAGGGLNYSQSGNTSRTTTTATGSFTNFYDADNHLTHDTWIDNDKQTSGSDTFNASGVVTGKTLKADGSSETYTVLGTPGGQPLTLTPSSQVSFTSLGPLDVTRDRFNADGVLLNDGWTLSDGATGSDTFSGDGSGSGSITHPDGTTSTIALDAAGGITVDNLDADGDRVSQDWWRADGTHGVVAFDDGVMTSQYSYRTNGEVVIDDYAADGTLTDEQVARAGAVVNPDGTGFGKVANADGGHAVYFSDAYGDASIFQYSADGVLQGTNHASASRNGVGDYSNTWADGQGLYSSPYNAASAVVTEDDGMQRTLYFGEGRTVAQDWVTTDAGHGRDTFGADGSSEGERYAADGSSVAYTDDGQGSLTNAFFGTDGIETGDIWKNADGSHGSDNFGADGSYSGVNYAVDGSYSTSNDHANGSSAFGDYSAAGVLIGDRWTDVDGSHGSDSFGADGSSVHTIVGLAGDSRIQTTDASGNVSTQSYSASGVLTASSATQVDGISTTLIVASNDVQLQNSSNADGSGTTSYDDGLGNGSHAAYDAGGTLALDDWHLADGSSGTDVYDAAGGHVSTSDDGHHNTSIRYFDPRGTLLSDAWVKADGTHGTDTFGTDGSRVEEFHGTDGSWRQTTTDAAGNTTTNFYSASGVLQRDTWTHVDGTQGADQIEQTKFASASYQHDGVYSTTRVVGGEATITFYNAADEVTGSTTYHIPDEAALPTIGGGYAGPITTPYDMSVTANRGAGMSSAKIYLATSPGVEGAFFNWSETATEGSGTAGWTMEDMYSSSRAPHLSADPAAGLTPSALDDRHSGSSYYYALDGTYVGSDLDGAGASPASSQFALNAQTVTTDLGPLSSAAAGHGGAQVRSLDGPATPGGERTLLFTAPGTEPGQPHIYSATITSVISPAVAPTRPAIPDDHVEVAVYPGGVRSVRTVHDGLIVAQSDTWGDGQYWVKRNEGEMSGRLPGGITLADNHYYLDGKLLGTANDATTSLTSDNAQSVGVDSYPSRWFSAGSGGSNNGFPDPASDPESFTFKFQGDDGHGTTTYYKYVYDTLTTRWNNPDGSTGVGTFDLADNTGTQTVTYQDGTRTVSTNDGQGGYFIANYDADGTLASDKWRQADGTTGSDDFSGGAADLSAGGVGSFQRDGVYAIGRTLNRDNASGSVYDAQGTLMFSIDEFQRHNPYGGAYGGPDLIDSVNSAQTTFDANGEAHVQFVQPRADVLSGQTVMVNRRGEAITTRYDYQLDGFGYSGQTAASTWTTADGSKVEVLMDLSTGIGTETIEYTDGSSSKVAGLGATGYLDRDFNADGKLVAEQWMDDSGASGTTKYRADGAVERWTLQADGRRETESDDGHANTLQRFYAADHTLLRDSWSKADGSIGTDEYRPDRSVASSELHLGSVSTSISLGDQDSVVSSREMEGVVDGVRLGNGNNRIALGDGSDTVVVGNGNNQISLGDGDATVELGSGTNHLSLGNGVSSIVTHGGADTIALGSGRYYIDNHGSDLSIDLSTGAYDKLWFEAYGDDLSISVLGSDETVYVRNWQSGQAISELTSSSGQSISGTGIAQLVQAMAAFAPPAAGQMSYTPEEQQALAPLLAASWH